MADGLGSLLGDPTFLDATSVATDPKTAAALYRRSKKKDGDPWTPAAPTFDQQQGMGQQQGFTPDPTLQKQIQQNVVSDQSPAAVAAREIERTGQAERDFYAKNQVPLESQYHPSVGRRILGGVIGGLIGIHDPKQGMQAGEEIVNRDYYKNLRDYQARLGAVQAPYKEAISSYEGITKGEEAEAQRRAEEERAGAEKVRAWSFGPEAMELGHKYKMAEDLIVHPPGAEKKGWSPYTETIQTSQGPKIVQRNLDTGETREIQAPGGGQVTGMSREGGPGKALTESQVKAQNIQKAMDVGPQQPGESDQDYNKRQMDAYYTYIQREAESKVNSVMKQRAQADMMRARSVEEHNQILKQNAGNIPYLFAAAMADPQKLYYMSGKDRDGVLAYGQQHNAGLVLPDKMSSADQRLALPAQKSLIAADQIEQLMTDNPNLMKMIGPAAGRANNLSQFIGSGAIGMSDQDKQVFSEFVSDLMNLYATDISAINQGRAPAQMLKLFNDIQAKATDVPSVLKGHLQGVRDNANNNLAAIRARQGGTIPSQGVTPATPTPPAGPTVNPNQKQIDEANQELKRRGIIQ